MIGGMIKRYKWHIFRKRFDELRLSPILDYHHYCRQMPREPVSENRIQGAKTFRFVGGFESITDGQILWIRGEDLTISVSLKNAEMYLLPMQKSASLRETMAIDPGDETPEKIRWERVSALTEGARVFVGGLLACQDGRWSFVSTKEHPLIVIFYDGPDHSLATQAIRAGRQRGEYWNTITPYALIIGALCQIIIAVLFLSRPAFRLTVIISIVALFIPFYPAIPPGLLFTVVYRRLTWRSRMLRAYRDLARLPMRYLSMTESSCLLPNGERYGFIRSAELPPQVQEGVIPLLLPEFGKAKAGSRKSPVKKTAHLWHIFGALQPEEELPSQPKDAFATFGALPGEPEAIARRCNILAYVLELAAWIILFAGIGLNIFFLRMILVLL